MSPPWHAHRVPKFHNILVATLVGVMVDVCCGGVVVVVKSLECRGIHHFTYCNGTQCRLWLVDSQECVRWCGMDLSCCKSTRHPLDHDE